MRFPHRHYSHCASSLPSPLRSCDFLVKAIFLVRLPYHHYSLCASILRASLPLYDFLVIAMPLVSLPFLHHFPCASSLPYNSPYHSPSVSCLSFPVLSIGCVLTFPFFFHRFWIVCAFVIWACLPTRLIVADYQLCKLDTLSMYLELSLSIFEPATFLSVQRSTICASWTLYHLPGIPPWISWIGILT